MDPLANIQIDSLPYTCGDLLTGRCFREIDRKGFSTKRLEVSSSWRVNIPTFLWTGLSSTPFPFVFEFFFRLTRPLAPKREVLSSFYCSRNWWRVGGLPFGMLDSLLDEGLVETIDSSLSARGVPQSTQNLFLFTYFHAVFAQNLLTFASAMFFICCVHSPSAETCSCNTRAF